jgi:hypothetical protein
MSPMRDGIIIPVRITPMPGMAIVTPVSKITRRLLRPSLLTAIADPFCRPPALTLCAILLR